ncbi:MAG: response regulator [Anaerolineae bacterium]|jgi:two-component system cell cycle response regulator DivK|nr:response regulator [Anaerolineae bacterium]
MNPVFLYVEDDFSSRQVVKILITRVMKHEHLHIFENSADFMTRVHELAPKPTIIFLDIQMRPHDGYEVLSMLRQDFDFAQITVIAMTANVMSHDVEQLRAAGFNGLIGKPIDNTIFPQLVSRILAGEAIWYLP